MNKAKLTSLLLILCMAGSGVAAEASSFTAYAAEEETVITEDVNEEEEAVEEAPADEPEDEAAVEEPAEEPEEPVAEEPAEEPAAENVEEPADEAVTEDTEDVSVEAEELPVEEKEAEEVQEAQTDEFLIDAMRLVRLSDVVTVRDKFARVYDCDTFLVTAEWQTQGDLASLEIEFTTSTVVKKTGRSWSQSGAGDYNDDYNDDYNNIES